MIKINPRDVPAGAFETLIESGYPAALAKIFAARGIASREDLDTSLSQLLPFDNLKNAREMARMLADAIAAGKKMRVVADYDADGATACAVALRGLRNFGAQVDYIVPNRFEYGYGLTPEIVRLAASRPPEGRVPDGVLLAGAAQNSPAILITVDNGIASVDGVAEANRLGMQVLVTDHHLPGDALPDAACIVNPNQPGCTFPSKHLAGVGVMFYVLLALRAELRSRGAIPEEQGRRLADLLDLVALGTVADVVKLDRNNRILVQQGLLRIRAGRACAGINALLRAAKKNPASATSHDLGFAVGPRLNAAGRLDDMSMGIECLLADDEPEAMRIAAKLDALNRERRSIESDMQETAFAVLEQVDPKENYSLALFDDSWHQGVIGILASRLKDRFHRPTIAFARAGDSEIKGSGRSIAGLHLRDALDLVSKRHPSLIRKFGGHAAAAGLSIAETDFDGFVSAFETVCRELLRESDLAHRVETDGALDTAELNLEIARLLEQQVWGQGFPAPQFSDEFTVQNQRVVGEKHLRLRLSKEGRLVEAILFGHAEPLPDRIHAVYSLNVNEYNDTQSLQLVIRHWREA